ncbi:MAG: cytochrome c [Gemmatimonadales bacterium]
MSLRSCALMVVALVAWSVDGVAQQPAARPKLGPKEYEGWRQYNANCARCHGQDVLGNPVAADLLTSAAAGGPVADEAAFVAVVKSGRPARGMPGSAATLSDTQVEAIYAYVKGRADGKIPAGRPERAGG